LGHVTKIKVPRVPCSMSCVDGGARVSTFAHEAFLPFDSKALRLC